MAGETDLAQFVSEVVGSEAIRVEESFGDGFVRLMVDEAERRQARHDIRCVEDAVVELLRNARDAGASSIYVASWRSEDVRSVVVLDDGEGIPLAMQDRVFEARVTSKLDSVHEDRWGVHGRGMALFSIRANALSARVAASDVGLGTAVATQFSTARLPERAEQSAWPSVGRDENGEPAIVRGPHNIVRACCEFALEEKGRVEVFLGSPAEILATLVARAKGRTDESSLLFVDDPSTLPVCARPLWAADARSLATVAESLGLPISERTAHRILSGAIRPVRSVLARLSHRKNPGAAAPPDLMRDRRGLKVAREDLEEFSRALERDFAMLEERYYLNLSGPPHIKVTGDSVRVVFELDKGDEG